VGRTTGADIRALFRCLTRERGDRPHGYLVLPWLVVAMQNPRLGRFPGVCALDTVGMSDNDTGVSPLHLHIVDYAPFVNRFAGLTITPGGPATAYAR
jgi:hypothetical protein